MLEEACTNSDVLQEVALPSTVRSIGWKAFAYNENLRRVAFADGLESIGGFAFMYAALERVELPESLRSIGEKAFYSCGKLRLVRLNEGLESLGESAFALTDLTELHVPRSVNQLGSRILQPKDQDRAVRLHIDPENPFFASDPTGFGTYRLDDDGMTLVECRGNQPAYEVVEGTRTIGPRAFAFQKRTENVRLPEGLLALDEGAFQGCWSMRTLQLPASLRTIGPRAFFECGLRHLRLPAGLQEVDDSAFLVNGNPTTPRKRHALELEVDPANQRFFMHTGVLCQHLDDGTDRAIIYTDSCPVVDIPRSVAHLGRYLFFGASAIDELSIHDGIASFGSQAFGVLFPIGRIHMTLGEPLEGRSELDFHFGRSASLSLNFIQVFREGLFDAKLLLHASDQAIYFMSNRFRRAKLMLRRLSDPFLLTSDSERKMRLSVEGSLTDICTTFAERHFNEGLAQLFDLGFIDEGNVDGIIERVHATGSVSSSAYLLEMKHRRFGTTAFSEYDI